MATLNEHIYFIKRRFNKGSVTDDHRIKNSEYKFSIDYNRSLLLKRELDKKSSIAESNFQYLCIDLIDATPSICDIPESLIKNCKLKRSVNKIPKYIASNWSNHLQVSYPDGRNISMTKLSMLHRNQYRLATDVVEYFMLDEYLFISGDCDIEKIQIKALFEDPSNVDETSSCPNSTDQYPLDSSLFNSLYELVTKYLLFQYQFPEDQVNDARETQPTKS